MNKDIVFLICLYAKVTSRLRMAQVCKQWNNILKNTLLWQRELDILKKYTSAPVSIEEIKYIGLVCELHTFRPEYRLSIYQLLLGYLGELYDVNTEMSRNSHGIVLWINGIAPYILHVRHNDAFIHLPYKMIVFRNLSKRVNKRFNNLLY